MRDTPASPDVRHPRLFLATAQGVCDRLVQLLAQLAHQLQLVRVPVLTLPRRI
jgi:hypothetical protein